MQVGSARGANENRLWYATLWLRPAYAETGGVARLRPLTRSTPTRDAESGLGDFGGTVCGMQRGCGPASSLAIARFLRRG